MITKERWFRVLMGCSVVTAAVLGVTVTAAAPSQATSLGYTCVRNVYIHTGDGSYLDVKGSGGSTTPVITWYYNGDPNQLWCLEKASEGGYYLHPNNNVGGLCLDVPHGNAIPYEGIWVYTCNGSAPQRWSINATGNSTTISPLLNTDMELTYNGKGNQVYLYYGGLASKDVWYLQN